MEKQFNGLNTEKSDCRNFAVGANYVDWKLNNENIVKRYYYIHDYNSIKLLAEKIDISDITYTIAWEEQNWFILFCKQTNL